MYVCMQKKKKKKKKKGCKAEEQGTCIIHKD
jgi:hypothetical protein